MAAWAAAQRLPRGRVWVLERLPRAGVKLAATGGGRGNLSHLATEEQFASAFGRQGRFTLPAFRLLPPEKLRNFWRDLGIPTLVDSDGRIYPACQSAARTRDALLSACQSLGVRFRLGTAVTRLLPPDSPSAGWRVNQWSARAVLLAAGGASAPHLGSDGSGFRLAESLGYSIVPPVPALTSLATQEDWPKELAGLTIPHVVLRIRGARGSEAVESGSLLFTHKGISGPCALNLSGRVARRLRQKKPVHLELGLAVPAPDFDHGRKTMGSALVLTRLAREIPRALAQTLLELSGIPPRTSFAHLSATQQCELQRRLKALWLTVDRTGDFSESMVTAGGIALREVNPENLEGKRTSQLYFAGEILDLDGPTGGWNLHWAFCSGYLAGSAATRSIGG